MQQFDVRTKRAVFICSGAEYTVYNITYTQIICICFYVMLGKPGIFMIKKQHI